MVYSLFKYRLDICLGAPQPHDHLDTWLGIGGFRYRYKRGKGYYLFLYYGSKYTIIHLYDKDIS